MTRHITKYDPELSKHSREKYRQVIYNGFKVGAIAGLLLIAFIYYKGSERGIKLDKQNKEQYGNKL